MKYVALVYYQESIINNMTEQEWHDLNQECIAGVEKLTSQGKFVTGQPLQPIDTATTVRVRDDEVPVCRNQGTTGGLLPAGCQRPERGSATREPYPPCALWQH